MSDNTGGRILSAKWGIWAALGAVVLVALMFGAVANTVAATPATSYTVKITETGLPSGAWWQATLTGGTVHYSKGTVITFTSVAAASDYIYTPPSPANSSVYIQYVPSVSYTYLTVPNTLSVTVAYTTQYYETFAVSPTSSGYAYPGSGWYNAGSEVAISAYASSGYSFTKWTNTSSKDFHVAQTSQEATEVQMLGVGTLTAAYKTTTTAVTFDEVGLPSSTSWSVTYDGASSSGTGSSIKTAAHTVGNYQWTISPVSAGSTEQYAAEPSSGYVDNVDQSTQEVTFVKQFLVTWTTSPSGTTSPTGAVWYNNGSVFPILAENSAGNIFSKWSGNESKVGLGNTANAGTNATVKASTTITAHFGSGTECTTCKLTFNEVGLPSGTSWGVSLGAYNFVSSSSSLSVSGLTAGASWSAFTPVSAGQFSVAYIPVTVGGVPTGSGYWSLGITSTIEVVYAQYAWVTFNANPSNSGSATQTTGWYQVGVTYPLSAIGSPSYTFTSWTSSGKNVTLGSTTSSSTTMVVKGPGLVTASFQQPTSTIHFIEYGLPKGTTWGVYPNNPTGVWYTSDTSWLNITDVGMGGYYWSALTNIFGGAFGLQWMPWSYYNEITTPYQNMESVVYAEQAQVAFATSGTAGGSIFPTSTTWYWVGTVLAIYAGNGTTTPTAKFSSWSDTAGTGTITSTSSASTWVTVTGTGTVTAKFT
jgi:hypothetical protein